MTEAIARDYTQPPPGPASGDQGLMSGGPVRPPFFKGWALYVFGFGKVHWWTVGDDGWAYALCYDRESLVSHLHEAGNWPVCKRCLKQRAGA